MGSSFKGLLLTIIIFLTASCEETLDTSSQKAIDQSIKQMMVGIYPENQQLFKKALTTIYQVDQKLNPELSLAEVTKITHSKLQGKTVEEILYLSYASKKIKIQDLPIKTKSQPVQIIASNSSDRTVVKTVFE